MPLFIIYLFIYMDHNQILQYRSLHLQWSDIAILLGVSRKRLELWQKRVGFEEAWLSFDDTVRVVRDFFERNPSKHIGEVCLMGMLRAEGYRVTRKNLRAGIYIVIYILYTFLTTCVYIYYTESKHL